MPKVLLRRGFITLISVLILGAIAFTVSTALILLGLGSERTAFLSVQSSQAKSLVDACIEEALQQIKDSSSYTGAAGFSLGQGTCTYTVTDTGGTTRTINGTGTVGTVVRKAQALLDQVAPPNVTSWLDVADF